MREKLMDQAEEKYRVSMVSGQGRAYIRRFLTTIHAKLVNSFPEVTQL